MCYSRFLILSLFASLIGPRDLPAEVSLYGMELKKQDYVGVDIVQGSRYAVTVNAGYAQGVMEGNRFLVFRDLSDGFHRICDLEILKVSQKTSVGRPTRNIELKSGDKLVIEAADLNLWRVQDRQKQSLLTRLTARRQNDGYDTRDTTTTPTDLLELERPNAVRYREWQTHLGFIREKYPRAYVDLTGLREELRRRNSQSGLEVQLEKAKRDFAIGLDAPLSPANSQSRVDAARILISALDRLKKIRTGPTESERLAEEAEKAEKLAGSGS
jgi:hypothetical protein